jgi:hypothetical protein
MPDAHFHLPAAQLHRKRDLLQIGMQPFVQNNFMQSFDRYQAVNHVF